MVQVLTGQQHPSFTINKPLLFNNGAANVSTNVVRSPALCPSAPAVLCTPRWAAQTCTVHLPTKQASAAAGSSGKAARPCTEGLQALFSCRC